jgi:hypothetical protein
MGSSSSARGLDISIASKHCRSSLSSRADINLPEPAYGCPESTSASPGRHSASSGRHIYVPAGIFMSRPIYVGPGSTLALHGPAYNSPGRHIIFPGQNSRSWAGIQRIRPFLADISSSWANPGWASGGQIPAGPAPGLPGWAGARPSRLGRIGFPRLGQFSGVAAVPAGLARDGSRLGRRGALPRLGRPLPSPARSVFSFPRAGRVLPSWADAFLTRLGLRFSAIPAPPGFCFIRPVGFGWAAVSARQQAKPASPPVGQAAAAGLYLDRSQGDAADVPVRSVRMQGSRPATPARSLQSGCLAELSAGTSNFSSYMCR